MKIIKPYFNFDDERGHIKGIINQGSWEEINYVFSKKGTIRANHYHKNLKELFIILEGIINIHFFNIKTPDQIEIKTAKKGDVFLFEKEIFHRFEVMEDSIWLNVLSQKIDPNNPDIHTFEGHI